ncbi:MAG: hypothetical protein ACJAVL_000061 [Bacteroidia bacterium]|jgi:hypothetical protein
MSQRVFLFVLGISCFASWKSFAQVDSLNLTSTYPDTLIKGIYWSYEQLKGNQPAYTDSFEIIKAINRVASFQEYVTLSSYRDRIKYKNKYGDFVTKNAIKVFGYCDGDSMYISDEQFHPIHLFGSLCVVKVKQKGSSSSFHAPGNGFGSIHTLNGNYILNLLDKEMKPMHVFVLEDAFWKYDRELYKIYRKTKQRKKLPTMLEFIVKFNKRKETTE